MSGMLTGSQKKTESRGVTPARKLTHIGYDGYGYYPSGHSFPAPNILTSIDTLIPLV
jgi:hypothetical protein